MTMPVDLRHCRICLAATPAGAERSTSDDRRPQLNATPLRGDLVQNAYENKNGAAPHRPYEPWTNNAV